jgi:hypothetical protein
MGRMNYKLVAIFLSSTVSVVEVRGTVGSKAFEKEYDCPSRNDPEASDPEASNLGSRSQWNFT